MVIKASGVAVRRPDAGGDRRLRPRRRARRGRARAVQRRRHPRLRLPPHAATSAASRTPTAPYATAWAARGEAIPCVLTAMADEFGGEIPIGPFALIGDEEIGRGIVETLAGHRSPAVLMRSHGVFTIGAGAARRDQGRGDVRGRRPHRASRARARRPDPADQRGHRCAPRPLPERLRAALTPTPRPPADRPAGHHAEPLRRRCSPASPSARRATPREVAAALADVADVARRRARQRARGRRARDARARSRASLDGLLVVMLTYGPAMRVARLLAQTRAADLPGQHPARRRPSPPTWDMADLTYNQGIHGAQDTANAMVRAGRPFHVITDDWHARVVPRRGRRAGRGAAAAVTRWRSLKVAVFGYAMNGDGRHPRRRARADARARPADRRARAGRAVPRAPPR